MSILAVDEASIRRGIGPSSARAAAKAAAIDALQRMTDMYLRSIRVNGGTVDPSWDRIALVDTDVLVTVAKDVRRHLFTFNKNLCCSFTLLVEAALLLDYFALMDKIGNESICVGSELYTRAVGALPSGGNALTTYALINRIYEVFAAAAIANLAGVEGVRSTGIVVTTLTEAIEADPEDMDAHLALADGFIDQLFQAILPTPDQIPLTPA